MSVYKFELQTSQKQAFVNIDEFLFEAIRESGVKSGLAVVYCPHTTAAVTINENADPDVKRDLNKGLDDTFPNHDYYVHFEGNSDGHMKSSVIGASETVIIDDGEPILGRWQSVFLSRRMVRGRVKYMLKSWQIKEYWELSKNITKKTNYIYKKLNISYVSGKIVATIIRK